ncbi:MAG: hypothetical protein GC151_06985 [Betaproteobacteria bacterium]|nr:hypothetical protein [Betaproteobacteria bacterium]
MNAIKRSLVPLLSGLSLSLAFAIPSSAADTASPDSGKATQSAAQERDQFSLRASRDVVLALPEVKAWHDKRQAEASNAPHGPPTGGIVTALRRVDGVKHWAVTLYENPRTDARKWAVFLVRARDGAIFVEGEDGRLLTLEAWRRTRPSV